MVGRFLGDAGSAVKSKKVRQQGKREGKTLLPQECGVWGRPVRRLCGVGNRLSYTLRPRRAKIKPFPEKSGKNVRDAGIGA